MYIEDKHRKQNHLHTLHEFIMFNSRDRITTIIPFFDNKQTKIKIMKKQQQQLRFMNFFTPYS